VAVAVVGAERDTERAMSEQNVEIARRTYAAFNRRDLDGVLEGLDPDVEWQQITQFPDRAVYRGHGEMRDRFMTEQLIEQFPDFRVEVEELVEAGDHVVMIGRITGHGGASGAPIDLRVVNVLEMRDGMIIRAYDVAGPSHRP
jgi:uncharacterized protein